MYPVEKPTIAYYLRAIITWFISCAQLVSQLLMMSLQADDLSKITSALYYCMTQTAYICKLVNFSFRRKILPLMENELNNPLFNTYGESQDIFLQDTIGSFKRIAAIFRILCILVVFFYGLFPAMDNNPENPLPLPGWYPFDIKKYRYEIYVFQVLSVAVSAYNNANIDILTSGLISAASVQFQILKDNLVRITDDLQDLSTARMNTVVSERLQKSVVHHNDILV